MRESISRYRWFVVAIFFFFMLLHQTDRLMIGSMQEPVMNEFGITDLQWGLINTGALVVSTLLYPIWGYSSTSARFSALTMMCIACAPK